MSLFSDVTDWLHRTYDSEISAFEDLSPISPTELLTGLGSKSFADVVAAVWSGELINEALGPAAYLTILLQGARATTAGTAQALNTQMQSNLSGAGMAQLIIPSCFQVTIQMVAGGHPIENVIGVRNASGSAAGAAAAVLAAWKIASGPLTGLSSLVTMVGVRAVDISSSNGAIVTVGDTTAGGTTVTNQLATRGACAVVQWNGGTRSRSSRGRLYYGPTMESDIQADGATLGTAIVTSINTRFTNFRNSLSGASYPLVVLSRKLSQDFSVTSHVCEATIGTQRRRIR